MATTCSARCSLEPTHVIADGHENGSGVLPISPSAGASSLPESRWVSDEVAIRRMPSPFGLGILPGGQPDARTLDRPVLLGGKTGCMDRAVAEFLSGSCPWLPEPAQRLQLFRFMDLERTRRTWRLHRQQAASCLSPAPPPPAPALAPASMHHAMLIILLPQSYSQHLGGEMEVGGGADTEPLASPPARPLLVILPAGLPFRWRPLRAGVRYWLSSPLDVPRLLVSPPPTVRLEEELPRPDCCASVPELEGALRRVRARMAALREEEAALEGQLRAAAEAGLTRTLARLDNRLSLSPPFVVILRERYGRGSAWTGSPCLRGDDALTFAGLLRRFPGCEPRLLNVAVHLPAEEAEGALAEDGEGGEVHGRRETWEAAISECPGWVGEEAAAGDEDAGFGGEGTAARLLRGLPCVYGGDDMPGAIESVTAEEIANLRWSVLLLPGGHP